MSQMEPSMDRLTEWLRRIGALGWQLGGVAVGFLVIWTIFQRLLLVVTVLLALLASALPTPCARWLERPSVPQTGATILTLAGSASQWA